MQSVAVRGLRRRNDVRDVEVALSRWWRSDADGLVGELEVERVSIGGRVDAHGFDAQLVQRSNDPYRDLAPVRDEDAREHEAAP
jgi:hypothetical protein